MLSLFCIQSHLPGPCDRCARPNLIVSSLVSTPQQVNSGSSGLLRPVWAPLVATDPKGCIHGRPHRHTTPPLCWRTRAPDHCTTTWWHWTRQVHPLPSLRVSCVYWPVLSTGHSFMSALCGCSHLHRMPSRTVTVFAPLPQQSPANLSTLSTV